MTRTLLLLGIMVASANLLVTPADAAISTVLGLVDSNGVANATRTRDLSAASAGVSSAAVVVATNQFANDAGDFLNGPGFNITRSGAFSGGFNGLRWVPPSAIRLTNDFSGSNTIQPTEIQTFDFELTPGVTGYVDAVAIELFRIQAGGTGNVIFRAFRDGTQITSDANFTANVTGAFNASIGYIGINGDEGLGRFDRFQLVVANPSGNYGYGADNLQTRNVFAVAVPEPASFAVLAIGAGGFGWLRRRRRPAR